MAWFNACPALYQSELDALNQATYQYKIDGVASSQGRLVINVEYLIDGEPHNLECHYPSAYPFFAIKVFAPTFPAGRHLDPISGGLCLFEDEQNVWDPSRDTLASALREQVPLILRAHAEPGKASDIEGNVGYQISGQIQYENRSVIFVDEWDIPSIAQSGEMTIRLHQNHLSSQIINGFTQDIKYNGSNIDTVNVPLEHFYPLKQDSKWVKLDAPPLSMEQNKVLNEAIKILPELKTPHYSKHGFEIIGLIFPEESEYKKIIYNWIFVVRRKPVKIKKQAKQKSPNISLVRSDRLTAENISKRVPRLQLLRNKKVTIFGLGALGSHIIWQLVRAGVESITMVDHDIVQAGNMPRWMLGFSAIGYFKVQALEYFFKANFPNVKCNSFPMRIGNQQIQVNGGMVDEDDLIKKVIDESDVVIDAVAEKNISLYLSSRCRELDTSYIWATGTQGGWGGIVGRVVPDVTKGCWTCFSYDIADEKFKSPSAEEGSDIQPVGCFHPTFTGAGFDLDHISLMATRLTISTLLQGEDNSYTDFNWDFAVLNLFDEDSGIPIEPRWETHKLNISEKHLSHE